MIYGIRITMTCHGAKAGQWVQFHDNPIRPSEVPTPTTSLAAAQAALEMCHPEWRAEIVQLSISWRKTR